MRMKIRSLFLLTALSLPLLAVRIPAEAKQIPYEGFLPALCAAEDGADPASVRRIDMQASYVPEPVLQAFVDKNWTLVSDGNGFGIDYSDTLGVTYYGLRTIRVRADSPMATCHEFGHFLDWYCGFPSESEEFRKIYESELPDFESKQLNNAMIHSPSEFFAETFFNLCKDPLSTTPEAARIVREAIDKVTEDYPENKEDSHE